MSQQKLTTEELEEIAAGRRASLAQEGLQEAGKDLSSSSGDTCPDPWKGWCES